VVAPPSSLTMYTPNANLTQRIIGLAMRMHTHLGPGLLESAYEHCLCHESATRRTRLPR
jgi:GxxExxY protein